MKKNKKNEVPEVINVPKTEIILGLDISTVCIGCCIFLKDIDDIGKIIKLTHVVPKTSSKIKGIERLFLKKEIFETEFLTQWKDKGITRVVIEEPLLSSNNVNTVATLLRFNGMISDSVYRVLGIVPDYISSYDARKYAFPDLVAVRKYDKNGDIYNHEKIIQSIKKSNLKLFGSFPFDCDKKFIMMNKINELFPDINWIYDKKGELKKENFDANDALVTCLAFSNKLKYGDLEHEVLSYSEKIHNDQTEYEYNVKYWDQTIKHKLTI